MRTLIETGNAVDDQTLDEIVSSMAGTAPPVLHTKTEAPAISLIDYFDRVAVITLDRTPDRLKALLDHIETIDWPLRDIEIINAVDGTVVEAPSWWKEGGPAWGCMQSHSKVVRHALRDKIQRLLVLEDDVGFQSDLRSRLLKFLQAVPDDWDNLMIGGQQLNDGESIPVSPGVMRVNQFERMHCYALNRFGMESLYRWWQEPISGHCDWQIGDWQGSRGIRAYAPHPIIAHQRSNMSTITYAFEPARSWDNDQVVNPQRVEDVEIFRLNASAETIQRLRKRGLIHSGRQLDSNGTNQELVTLLNGSEDNQLYAFQAWCENLRRDASAYERAVAVVWWPSQHDRFDFLCHHLRTINGDEPEFVENRHGNK